MEEIERYGFREFDVSNDIGQISMERILEVIPKMGISSIMTEGTNDIARFLLDLKLADVMMPLFDGKELQVIDEGVELISPRMVTMGDTIVYFSSSDHGS